MKKLFLLCLLLCAMTGQAQELFTLEKSLDGQYYLQFVQYDDDDNFEDQLPYVTLSSPSCDMGYYYSTACSGNTFTLSLVSPTYEVSTKQYTFDLPAGSTLRTCYPTNKLLPDKSLVFLLSFSSGSLDYCGLYGTDGKLIQSFASGYSYANVYPMLFRLNGTYKLIVWKASLSGSTLVYKTDIYALKEEYTSVKALHEDSFVPYPVPSNMMVNIPYSANEGKHPLLIFDSNGAMVASQPLERASGTAFVNVMTYRPGVYLYRIGEQTGKFVVN